MYTKPDKIRSSRNQTISIHRRDCNTSYLCTGTYSTSIFSAVEASWFIGRGSAASEPNNSARLHQGKYGQFVPVHTLFDDVRTKQVTTGIWKCILFVDNISLQYILVLLYWISGDLFLSLEYKINSFFSMLLLTIKPRNILAIPRLMEKNIL